MDKFVLSANLINAIQKYLVGRPFGEVANLVLALQQQVNEQLPKDEEQQSPAEQ